MYVHIPSLFAWTIAVSCNIWSAIYGNISCNMVPLSLPLGPPRLHSPLQSEGSCYHFRTIGLLLHPNAQQLPVSPQSQSLSSHKVLQGSARPAHRTSLSSSHSTVPPHPLSSSHPDLTAAQTHQASSSLLVCFLHCYSTSWSPGTLSFPPSSAQTSFHRGFP